MEVKHTYNPSISNWVNIVPVYDKEVVNILIEDADEVAFTGTYEVRVYNSSKKNELLATLSNLLIDAHQLTIQIDNANQGIEVGKHYYELWDTSIARIEMQGELIIKD